MNESGCRSRYSRRLRTLLNLNEGPDRGNTITGDDEQHVPPGWRDVGRSWGARHELPAAASGDGEADVACAGVGVVGYRRGRSSATEPMLDSVGVVMVIGLPWPTVVGTAVTVGRGPINRYGGLKISMLNWLSNPSGPPAVSTRPSGTSTETEW
jgi:hypothetical protein